MKNNKFPLVSIGIPTYNRADGYLEQALRSALAQTYNNIEIIISDNGSTDHTEDVVKEFSDSRIRYFKHIENVGLKNNFNFCVKEARGDYFLLLCDDDLIDSDLVEVCMEAVNFDTNVGVILTGTRLIDENGDVVWEAQNTMECGTATDFFLGWFSNRLPLYLCSTLYNTEYLRKIGGFHSKTNCFLDVVATVKLAASNGKLDIYDAKASFRRHADNKGGSPQKIHDWCEDCHYLLDVMCELADDDKEDLVRLQGLKYFCRKNYRLASTMKSPMVRFKTFLKVYRMFNYSYSPFRFAYNRNVRPLFQKGIRRLTR